MSGTRRAGGAAARLLALLAVVLGLLAMHGLASTHHAAASPVHLQPATAGGGVQVQSQERAGMHSHESVAGARTAALPGGALALAVPACGDECPSDVAVLCAAVVAVAAATAWRLAAAAAGQCVPGWPAHRASQPRAPDAARRLIAGPDLVSELCVSRT